MRHLVLGATLALVTGSLDAQQAPSRARLDSLLGTDAMARIQRLIDGAAAAGLPVEPLWSVAGEGAARRMPGERVVAAVNASVRSLTEARDALGPTQDAATLAAAASALQAGASPAHLGAMRGASPSRSLTLPLVILADMLTRGVPADTAVRALYVGVHQGASDAELEGFRRSVERDIRSGAAPGSSAIARLGTLRNVAGADIRRLWSMPQLVRGPP